MKTELQTIETSEMENVTGGETLWQNIGKGANDVSNDWANNTLKKTSAPFGTVGGGFLAAGAGFFGGIFGGLRGVGATLGLGKVP